MPYAQVADVVALGQHDRSASPAYLELRDRPDELFIDTVARVGIEPFKERVYAVH